MNLSQLLSSPSYTVSPSLNPFPGGTTHLPFGSISLPKRRRVRVAVPRDSSNAASSSPGSLEPSHNVFGDKRELTGVQILLESLPSPVRVAASVAVTAGALAAGYGLGFKYGGTRNLALGGAAAAGVATGAAVYSLNSCMPDVAAVALHNFFLEFDDPKEITKEHIDSICKRYGINKSDGAFSAELRDLYCRFVASVLPPGGKELQGDEVAVITNFKNALGIEDPDAAAMHMEIGRRIFRERLETSGEGDVEQHRAFQKLIYVSNLVFGKASSFLLPWKRVFKITDSQVEIALRDTAQRLYALKLRSVGRDVNVEQLVELRQLQLSYKVPDEIAIDLFRQRIGIIIDNTVTSALEILTSSSRTGTGFTRVVVELEKILELNNKLILFGNQPDSASYARGVGPISLVGVDIGTDRRMDDLKLLYSVYVTDALSGGYLEESKLSGFVQLPKIFGLGKQEAETITLDITTKVYRKCLAQSVSSGELDSTSSKAAYLQKLCERLHFDPQRATKVHEDIYRQKLQSCVSDGELTEEDVSSLNRVRVLLCIPHQTVEATHSAICGSLFEKVVYDTISSGVEGFDENRRKSVIKSIRSLRLTEQLVLSITTKSILKMFVVYVKRALAAKKRSDGAQELKKMLSFNSLVVTPLINDIKAEFSDSSSSNEAEESIEIETKSLLADDDWDKQWESLETLKKVKAGEEAAANLKRDMQTEVNLQGELPLDERMELYKRYLVHCVSGKVVTLPFGAQLPIKSDYSEFAFLNQLGFLLGLSVNQIVEVHKNLAERAFQKKARTLLSDGQITKGKMEQLSDIQQKIGLPEDSAQSIIKNITSTKIATVIQNALDRGSLNMKQIRDLKEANVDMESLISERLREELFKKTVDDMFSSGTGEFDTEEVYEKITSDLKINPDKAKIVVHELAKRKLSNSLIQAVSLLRQRNSHGVVTALNNLLSCDKAVPSEPLSWESSQELAELYTYYLKSTPTFENLSRLQCLLGLSDSAVSVLTDTAKSSKDGMLLLGAEEENFVF